MNDLMEIAAFLRRIDNACARMNTGLAALASVLAVLVVIVGVIRASEYANAISAEMASPYAASSDASDTAPYFSFWTYN